MSDTTTSINEIDKILESYAQFVYSESPDFYVNDGEILTMLNKAEAKAQIATLIEQVIGENIYRTWQVEGSSVAKHYVNKMLAEQRARAERLLK